MEKFIQNIPLDFIDIQNLNSFEKIDPALKELFSIPIHVNLEKIKSILMIHNKGKNVVKLNFRKNTKEIQVKKTSKVYSIKRKDGKNLILVYDLDEDENSGSRVVYVEVLYEDGPQKENEIYRFNSSNGYRQESVLAPINIIEGNIKEKNKQETLFYSNEPEKSPNVVVIEYETPLKAINQEVYQRVFLKNDAPNNTLYDSLFSSGLDIKTSYNEEFDCTYVDSINGVRDGDKNRFWEFYVNGKIGTTSVDKQKLDEGDIVEWRLAEEKPGGCGGGYLKEVTDLATLLIPGNYQRKNFSNTPWYIS